MGKLTLPVHEEGLPDVNAPFDAFAAVGNYNYPYTLRTSVRELVASLAGLGFFFEQPIHRAHRAIIDAIKSRVA
jgi:hypothetical protein